MPQDSLKSVVYRSFVTCDDPKGVADSKTIRKSKKTEQKSRKNSTSLEREREELQTLSCFQVMEVSRGAERLHEAVDRPSKHIAADLLRGALHLQESLVMLGKLQEASSTFISARHSEKRPLDLGNSDFEKPRISASRDCYDELRDVIRESFARQNLLSENDKICGGFDRKHSESSCSSSQTSSSASIRHGNARGSSSLIKRLMGLEEVVPLSRAADVAVFKERAPFRRSPLLDIDLPRARKPQFMVEKTVRERRTLEDIIETMQFKGILGRRKNSMDGSNDCKIHSNALFLRKDHSAAADCPPIVIMKPLRGGRDQDGNCINVGEQIKKQMPRKTRPELPSRPQLKTNERSAVERASKEKLDGSKEGRAQVRPVKKAAVESKPPLPRMQKKEAPKVRKPAEAKEAKPQKSDKNQDFSKPAALKHSKTVRDSKSQIVRGKVASADKSMKMTPLNRAAPKKNPRRGESNSKASSALVDNKQSAANIAKDIETIIDDLLVKNTQPEQTTEEVANAYSMSDNSTNAASSPSDASGIIIDSDHIESDSCIPSFDSDEIKGSKTIAKNSRYLLLSTVSFLNHIEELFDTGTHGSTPFQTDSLPDSEVLHDSLLLDCAKEILERKSLSCRSTRNPWPENLLRRPKCHLPVEQLVGEISDSIEDLQRYSKPFGDVVLADSIYPMLERDLRRNEEVTGAWDSGWRKGYAMEAVDEVMHDVEEQVLSEIVADVIIEIM